jgi:hypothetical protein
MAVALYRFKSDFPRRANGSLVQSADDMVYLYGSCTALPQTNFETACFDTLAHSFPATSLDPFSQLNSEGAPTHADPYYMICSISAESTSTAADWAISSRDSTTR